MKNRNLGNIVNYEAEEIARNEVEKMSNLQRLLLMNDIVKLMRDTGAKIYDKESPEWYLKHFEYEESEDKAYFVCE